MSFLPPVARRLFVAACALALLGALRTSGSPEVKAQGFTLPYNYLPSADITDGRFLAQAGTKMETLVGVGADYEIYLDADQIENGKWQLGIFDGDTGKNAAGTVTASFDSGHWDWIKTMPNLSKEQLTYQLFEDPLGTVNPITATPACTWLGNKPTANYTCNAAYASTTYSSSAGMADNAWFDISLPANATRYRLYVKFATPGISVESAFRLRSSGKLTTVGGRPFQLLGAARRRLDYGVLYPNWDVTTYPGTPVLSPTTYNGEWSVYVELPAGQDRLDIWDGDLDHGSSNGQFGDTDDVDTLSTDIPPGGPYGNQAKPEAAMGKGAPSDDLMGTTQARWRRSPAIEYTVYDPNGTSYRNANPSGNREWEKFTICETCSDKDHTASDLPAGLYEIRVQGYDLDNINALLLQQDSYVIVKNGDADLGNTVWYDADDDGFKDPLESGISGVTVKATRDVNLNDVADPGEPYWTDVTDNSGLYLIENLADGAYVIEPVVGIATPLANFNQSTRVAAHQADLVANDQWNKEPGYIGRIINETNNLTGDFGFIAGGGQGEFKIGDTVFLDWDHDGTKDDLDEPGIAGVTLDIYYDWDGVNHLAGDGTFDGDEIYLTSVTTNASGEYFYNVPFDGQFVDYFVKVASSNFASGGPLFGKTATVSAADGQTGSAAAGPDISRPSPYRARVWQEDNLTADFGYIGGTICLENPSDPLDGATIWSWIDYDAGTVTVRVSLFKSHADNAFGDPNSKTVGWPGGKGRTWKQIHTSDQLELVLKNAGGTTVLDFKMDLLNCGESTISGYGTAGVSGGDGSWVSGNQAYLLDVRTSIDENVNNPYYGATGWWSTGYGGTAPDCSTNDEHWNSPQVDANYNAVANPNPPGAEEWIWDTWYEATVDLDAFGAQGYGTADVPSLHSSPSKTGNATPPLDPCT